jgi:hypothetical protein
MNLPEISRGAAFLRWLSAPITHAINAKVRNPTDAQDGMRLVKWSILLSPRDVVRVKWIGGDAESISSAF